jgi:hypothetical protein
LAVAWPAWDTDLVPAIWELTPRQSAAAGCGRRGEAAVIAGCIEVLHGRYEAVDGGLLLALGGPAVHQVLDGREGGTAGHWPRVWAVRGLLYACAAHVIIQATADDAWRVREMAAKVIARHRVADGLTVTAALRSDPVRRVRTAAERATTILTASGS